ncbi:uncharacterized protein AMSG_12000 [Thecamonas trahens ATCC 50062]|uniref:Uncharacterized protein n=1 Tax=Thecamonas trahens ATCC 50062 TaxID=461836 RepID=A0A0L0DEU2_THETB|nr:hypothetical protein AMSG_12000 [Thecamonas trahens ATCC 50062]KNC50740.1 hypothetical protein AMSG_12000 [Thecamonas trahens ATCC 50062]|eukprot:XP_013756821.1 hypothetical protein AMSG_12000 [Thecamonas trahens ATCC 50062]
MTSVEGPGKGCRSEAVAGDNGDRGSEMRTDRDGKQDDDAVVVLGLVADGVGEEAERTELDGKGEEKGEEGKAGERRGRRCRRGGSERRRRRWRTRRGVGERMLRRVARAEWRRAGGGGSGDILDSIGAMAASESETNQVLLKVLTKRIDALEGTIAKQASTIAKQASTIAKQASTIAKQATEAADTIREREQLMEHQDDEGYGPLYLAAVNGSTKCVKWLIRHGARLHALTSAGFTPLHGAAKYGELEVVRLLADAGADVAATDRHGRSPRDLARRGRHSSVVLYLEYAPDGRDADAAPVGEPLTDPRLHSPSLGRVDDGGGGDGGVYSASISSADDEDDPFSSSSSASSA